MKYKKIEKNFWEMKETIWMMTLGITVFTEQGSALSNKISFLSHCSL